MTVTIKEYLSEHSSRFTKADAQKIGPVLEALAEDGAVTARDVLDAARSTNSPLNPYFMWNDRKAADLFRLEQARQMLRAIKIRYVENGEMREVRAFHVSRTSAWESEARTYKSFAVLHDDSAFAAQMMQNAFEDLKAWRARYEPYTSIWKKFGDTFQAVSNQINEFADEYKSIHLPGETDDALARLLTWQAECQDVISTWVECQEQIVYVLEAVKEAEVVFAKLDGKVNRPCIRCGKPHKSGHVGNRICNSCSKTQKVESGVGEKVIAFI